MEILKEVFDKRIIEILILFIENSNKEFSLTDISKQTKTNISKTYRTLDNLTSKKIIKAKKIGKTKIYQLEKNEKTLELLKILDKNTRPLEDFIEKLIEFSETKKIILDSKEKNNAKIIIITEKEIKEKVEEIKEKIEKKYNFKIDFLELSENQLKDFENFNNNYNENIIWVRKK